MTTSREMQQITYEEQILKLHSNQRLRRAELDNPPEPEIPFHIYPVPISMSLSPGAPWEFYSPGIPYDALKYSDGSEWYQPGQWLSNAPAAPPPFKPCQSCRDTSRCAVDRLCLYPQTTVLRRKEIKCY